METPMGDESYFRHQNYIVIDVTQKSTSKTQFMTKSDTDSIQTLAIDWLTNISYCIALSFPQSIVRL